jgi:hypothetical protein
MNTFLSGILTYALLFLPPLISGPIPAAAFITIIKTKHRWPLLLFWVLVLIVDLIAIATMACSFGHAFFGPGFFALLLTPIAAIISLAILLSSAKAVRQTLDGNKQRQIWHIVGIVVIPSLQLLIAAVLPLVQETLACWMYRLGFSY